MNMFEFRIALINTAIALLGSNAASKIREPGGLPANQILYGHGVTEVLPSSSAPLKRQSTTSSPSSNLSCVHGPESRQCWSSGYSIQTDFDAQWPTTGQLRAYDWNIINTTCNPDGRAERFCSLVNGQLPGPVLEASKATVLTSTR